VAATSSADLIAASAVTLKTAAEVVRPILARINRRRPKAFMVIMLIEGVVIDVLVCDKEENLARFSS
jgi:hypothetical protein